MLAFNQGIHLLPTKCSPASPGLGGKGLLSNNKPWANSDCLLWLCTTSLKILQLLEMVWENGEERPQDPLLLFSSLSLSFSSFLFWPTCCHPQRLQPSLQSHISAFPTERSRHSQSHNTDVKHFIPSALRGCCLQHTDHGLQCSPGYQHSHRACLSLLSSVWSIRRDLGALQDDRDAEAGCILSQ